MARTKVVSGGLIFLAAAIVGAVSLVGYGAVHRWEGRQLDAAMQRELAELSLTLTSLLERHAQALSSIDGFFAASQEITEAEFASFVGPTIERPDGILAIGWAPGIPGGDSDSAKPGGIEAFRAPGNIGTPARPPLRFPVVYLLPAGNDILKPGDDLRASPVFGASVEAARSHPGVVRSTPFRLPGQSETERASLLLLRRRGSMPRTPALDQADPRRPGMLFAMLSWPEALRYALRQSPTPGVALTLVDPVVRGGGLVIAQHDPPSSNSDDFWGFLGPGRRDLRAEVELRALGQAWILRGKAGPGFLALHRRWEALLSLGFSLAVGILICGYAGLLRSRSRDIEELAARRTEELVAANRSLAAEIEERRILESERYRLQLLLTNIVDSMPSVLIGVDPGNRVTLWNRQAAAITRLSPLDTMGRPLGEVFPEIARLPQDAREHLDQGLPFTRRMLSNGPEGDLRRADITIYPLMGETMEGAVIRVDDVTDQVRMQELIAQSEKMLSLGGLAAGLAHEINNPLSAVLHGVQVLRGRFLSDQEANREAASGLGLEPARIIEYMKSRQVDDLLDGIGESAQRAASIVENMLSFSRQGSTRLLPHEITSLVDASVNLAASDMGLRRDHGFRSIRIEREYEADLPLVPCDASQLEQVLLNLLRNAAHALSGRTESALPPRILLRVQKEGRTVRIEVEDNGPGMPEEIRRRVFEPFFTTKEVGSGTGLGLAVAYFIVTETHGGTMEVVSSPGEGTRFIIRLPLRPTSASE